MPHFRELFRSAKTITIQEATGDESSTLFQVLDRSGTSLLALGTNGMSGSTTNANLFVNVKSPPHGAKGDGVTDDSPAIQSAIDSLSATGGIVFFPPGVYLVNNWDLLLRTGIRLWGCGSKSIVRQGFAHAGQGGRQLFKNSDTVNGNDDIEIAFLRFENIAPTFTPGSSIVTWSNAFWFEGCERVWIHHCEFVGGGIHIRPGSGIANTATALTGAAATRDIWFTDNWCGADIPAVFGLFQVSRAKVLRNIILDNYDSGIAVNSAGYQIEIAHNLIDKKNRNCTGLGQIEVTCDDVVVAGNPNTTAGRNVSMSDIDVHDNVLIGGASVPAPSYGIYFAGSQENVSIRNNVIRQGFTHGIDVTNYKRNCEIRGNRISRCAGHGILWAADGSRTHDYNTVADNIVYDNGVGGTDTVGIRLGGFAANAFDYLDVVRNRCYDTGPDTQKTGILLDFFNSWTNARVEGNVVKGSTAGITLSGSTPAGLQLRNNKGYNPLGATSPSVGASPWTYTAGPTPEVLHLRGGTVSLIVKNGVTLYTATPAAVPLEPGEAVTVTYSVAPTAVADRK